jgi:ribonuclease VapC
VSLFIDASAMTAIIAREPGWERLAARAGRPQPRLISAISVWETVAALQSSHGLAPDMAQAELDSFVTTTGLTYVLIGQHEAVLASKAHAAFGRGRHPAGLNMGDCFAYACARANRAALLFIGDDFRKTDIDCAL